MHCNSPSPYPRGHACMCCLLVHPFLQINSMGNRAFHALYRCWRRPSWRYEEEVYEYSAYAKHEEHVNDIDRPEQYPAVKHNEVCEANYQYPRYCACAQMVSHPRNKREERENFYYEI